MMYQSASDERRNLSLLHAGVPVLSIIVRNEIVSSNAFSILSTASVPPSFTTGPIARKSDSNRKKLTSRKDIPALNIESHSC